MCLAIAIIAGWAGTVPVEANGLIIVTTTSDVINQNDGECSLREAIIAANNNSISLVGECAKGSSTGTDVIQLQGGATYALTIGGSGEDSSFTGDLDILDNGTPEIDIRIEGVGGTAVVQINGTDRVWHVHGAGLELDHVQTSGGNVDLGGGLYNDNGQVTITNSSFSLNNAATGAALYSSGANAELRLTSVEISRNNASAAGGGIANQSGLMVLIDSTISGNSSVLDGGGISNNNASATLTRTRVSGNSSGGCGGGIKNSGTAAMTLINSEVTGINTADGSGGGICNEATLSVTQDSVISTNEANTGGGGIFNNGTLSLLNSTVEENQALDGDMDNDGLGGGIYSTSGSSTMVRQSAIISNDAATAGGGLVIDGTLSVFNSTISDNFATATGGLLVQATGSVTLFNVTMSENQVITGLSGSELHVVNGEVTLGNTIVTSTSQGFDSCANASGTINSVGHNISDDDTCFSDTSDQVNTDPLLESLTDGVRQLQPGSPAIDSGDMVLCAETAVASTDQLSQSRPMFDGCDIGAVEWQGFGIYMPLIISE